MKKAKNLKIFLIIILLGGNILLAYKYYEVQSNYVIANQKNQEQQLNKKIIDFLELFITKVLKSETEVSFEDRLKLENAVRELNDEEILEQWKKFTNSQSEIEAQQEVKNLMEKLVKKIK